MPLTEHIRKQFIKGLLLVFYALAIYKWFNGLWMYQMQPHFYTIPFDGTAWLVMSTGIHNRLADNAAAWALMDGIFYLAPLGYWITYQKAPKAIPFIGLLWCLFNLAYLVCYTIYPSNSIESYSAWVLFPIMLAVPNLKNFYLLLHGARYFFLFFFASAGFWKIYQGGVFHIDQMSGILLQQHAAQLVSDPQHWYSRFIYSIIHQPFIGYLLYLAGTVLELVFVAGFFTRRYDKWLIAGFIAFLIMDLLIMKIPYVETLPLLLPLLFSRYTDPEDETNLILNKGT